VKKIALAALLLLVSAFAWAGTNPNPAEYTINVHVSASRIVHYDEKLSSYSQMLNVVIDGKKYELESRSPNMLLAIGDYKAKLVKDEHKGTYDSLQVYEFLFPDQKTRKFTVVGKTE
jgi:hypothetical protein